MTINRKQTEEISASLESMSFRKIDAYCLDDYLVFVRRGSFEIFQFVVLQWDNCQLDAYYRSAVAIWPDQVYAATGVTIPLALMDKPFAPDKTEKLFDFVITKIQILEHSFRAIDKAVVELSNLAEIDFDQRNYWEGESINICRLKKAYHLLIEVLDENSLEEIDHEIQRHILGDSGSRSIVQEIKKHATPIAKHEAFAGADFQNDPKLIGVFLAPLFFLNSICKR